MEIVDVDEPKQKKQKTNDSQKHNFDIDIDFSLLHSERKPFKKHIRRSTYEPPSNKNIISINDYIQY